MIRPLLLIMQPRQITRCVVAISKLAIDKLWLSFMWEKQLEPIIAHAVERSGYTHFLLLADDTVPTQGALDLVLEHLPDHPVVTGYCNNDITSPLVNITRSPFVHLDRSVWADYDWYGRAEVESWPRELVPTGFAGAVFTGMSRAMWRRFPFQAITTRDEPRGYCSDWSLSTRLQRAGIPIVAPRGAFVEHVKWKSNTQETDGDPEKRLLPTVIPPQVRWQCGPTTTTFQSPLAHQWEPPNLPAGAFDHREAWSP